MKRLAFALNLILLLALSACSTPGQAVGAWKVVQQIDKGDHSHNTLSATDKSVDGFTGWDNKHHDVTLTIIRDCQNELGTVLMFGTDLPSGSNSVSNVEYVFDNEGWQPMPWDLIGNMVTSTAFFDRMKTAHTFQLLLPGVRLNGGDSTVKFDITGFDQVEQMISALCQ
jgi:hypothetical protein